jgi:hypothetical protein
VGSLVGGVYDQRREVRVPCFDHPSRKDTGGVLPASHATLGREREWVLLKAAQPTRGLAV